MRYKNMRNLFHTMCIRQKITRSKHQGKGHLRKSLSQIYLVTLRNRITHKVEESMSVLVGSMWIEWTVMASLLLPLSMEVIRHHVYEV